MYGRGEQYQQCLLCELMPPFLSTAQSSNAVWQLAIDSWRLAAVGLTVQALKDGGTLLQVGCGASEISVPLMSMGFREVNIVTSFRYTLSWPVVIRLVDAGIFGDVTRLITHTLPVEKTVEAFETCANRSTMAIKVQVGCGTYDLRSNRLCSADRRRVSFWAVDSDCWDSAVCDDVRC